MTLVELLLTIRSGHVVVVLVTVEAATANLVAHAIMVSIVTSILAGLAPHAQSPAEERVMLTVVMNHHVLRMVAMAIVPRDAPVQAKIRTADALIMMGFAVQRVAALLMITTVLFVITNAHHALVQIIITDV